MSETRRHVTLENVAVQILNFAWPGAVNLYGMEVLAPAPARHVQVMDARVPDMGEHIHPHNIQG